MQTFLKETLNDLEQNNLLRRLKKVSGSMGREIVIDGRRVLNFCSNNYLGLADDPRLREAAGISLDEEGLGSGASRLVCGHLSAHQLLEEKIARFKGVEKAVTFSTGYMANVGIISSLFDRHDVIFSDRLNHASIIDGILLSGAKMRRYPHNDMKALEELLKEAGDYKKKAIITDSVFSMDGDLAPLDVITSLAKKYNSLVMVDEAHALGVLGRNGKGAVEHFGLEGAIDIQMGTLSKAAGSFGAYCCGSGDLIDFLINKARSFIYTTGMPPSIAAAALKGVEIIEKEPSIREGLWDNTRYFLRALKNIGLDTMRTVTPIIPIFIGDADKAKEFSRCLFEKGVYAPAIRPPTVPRNTARLRLTVMATHTKEDLDFVIEALKKARQEAGLT
ncbi:MAG: 8-amino-7-oxononanoate synthase [Candidatus Omnitrophica bacterium]|nr:8-amino-7-oxononanoate synthase [Candidatus Omnitrophota bacterium]